MTTPTWSQPMPTDDANPRQFRTVARAVALGGAALLLFATSGASAAGDAAAGAALARTWCASCHLVDEPAAGSTTQGPPSFRTIARRQTMTPDALRTFLTNPHPPMPNL